MLDYLYIFSFSGVRTFKVTGKSQSERHAVAVELLFNVLPCSNQDNGLSGITTGSLQDSIEVLSRIFMAGRVVSVVLTSDLESDTGQNLVQLIVDPMKANYISI